MAFKLNGNPLAVDVAFSHNDIQYPANWLRLSTAEEKTAIGITEVADASTYDGRFYNSDGSTKPLDDKTETVDGVEYKTLGVKSQEKEIDACSDTTALVTLYGATYDKDGNFEKFNMTQYPEDPNSLS